MMDWISKYVEFNDFISSLESGGYERSGQRNGAGRKPTQEKHERSVVGAGTEKWAAKKTQSGVLIRQKAFDLP